MHTSVHFIHYTIFQFAYFSWFPFISNCTGAVLRRAHTLHKAYMMHSMVIQIDIFSVCITIIFLLFPIFLDRSSLHNHTYKITSRIRPYSIKDGMYAYIIHTNTNIYIYEYIYDKYKVEAAGSTATSSNKMKIEFLPTRKKYYCSVCWAMGECYRAQQQHESHNHIAHTHRMREFARHRIVVATYAHIFEGVWKLEIRTKTSQFEVDDCTYTSKRLRNLYPVGYAPAAFGSPLRWRAHGRPGRLVLVVRSLSWHLPRGYPIG